VTFYKAFVKAINKIITGAKASKKPTLFITLFTSTALMLVCLSVLCLTGCSTEGGTDTASTEAEYQDFVPLTEIKNGRLNVYVVLKVLSGQYWEGLADGIKDAGDLRDCNVYLGGPIGEGDWQTQDKLLNQAFTSGADAILLAPASSTALADTIDEIHSSGVPVILVDTILNDTSGFDTCYMTDNLQAGELAAEEMINQLTASGVDAGDEIQIAIQIASVSSQTVIDRLAGFNQYWSTNAPHTWSVIDEVKINNGDKAKAEQNCLDLLAEYPGVKGVFGCNNSSTIGFVSGLEKSGRDDVVLVGFDYADETAAFIANENHYASTMVQNQYDMGYKGLEHAIDIIDGQENEYKFVDTNLVVINRLNQTEYEKGLAGDGK
jgi:ribose transport system substrate-binding protein